MSWLRAALSVFRAPPPQLALAGVALPVPAAACGAPAAVLPLEHHIPAGDSAKFHVELK